MLTKRMVSIYENMANILVVHNNQSVCICTILHSTDKRCIILYPSLGICHFCGFSRQFVHQEVKQDKSQQILMRKLRTFVHTQVTHHHCLSLSMNELFWYCHAVTMVISVKLLTYLLKHLSTRKLVPFPFLYICCPYVAISF